MVDALSPERGHEQLGAFSMTLPDDGPAGHCMPWATGEWIGVVEGNDVSVIDIEETGLSARRPLGRHDGRLLSRCVADPLGRFFLTISRSGQIKLWDASGGREAITLDDMRGLSSYDLSRDGSLLLAVDDAWVEEKAGDVRVWSVNGLELRLQRRIERVTQKLWARLDPVGLRVAMPGPMPAFRLWSLRAPAGTEPVVLRHGPAISPVPPRFSPDGQWVATGDSGGLTLWPLTRRDAVVLRPDVDLWVSALRFAPDGSYLAVTADTQVTLFPLDGSVPPAPRTVFEIDGHGRFLFDLAISPDGELFVACAEDGSVWIGRDDGAEPSRLPGAAGNFVTFSHDGRLIALSPYLGPQVSVWDVLTERQVAVLSLPDTRFGAVGSAQSFDADGRLLTATSRGLLAWDVDTGDHEVLVEGDLHGFIADHDARRLAYLRVGERLFDSAAGYAELLDLDTGRTTYLPEHGLHVCSGAMDREGTVLVAGHRNGTITMARIGEQPHLMIGHTGEVTAVAIDPQGRWIASACQDTTVRLWPMPDLDQPPLHTLPREQLVAKLETLTNIRLVRDESSSTGWTLTHEPFAGWEHAPTW
jgi:WD40 repeat protein